MRFIEGDSPTYQVTVFKQTETDPVQFSKTFGARQAFSRATQQFEIWKGEADSSELWFTRFEGETWKFIDWLQRNSDREWTSGKRRDDGC